MGRGACTPWVGKELMVAVERLCMLAVSVGIGKSQSGESSHETSHRRTFRPSKAGQTVDRVPTMHSPNLKSTMRHGRKPSISIERIPQEAAPECGQEVIGCQSSVSSSPCSPVSCLGLHSWFEVADRRTGFGCVSRGGLAWASELRWRYCRLGDRYVIRRVAFGDEVLWRVGHGLYFDGRKGDDLDLAVR